MAKKGIKHKPISIETKEEIYRRFKNGESIRFLAKEYQITHQSIFTYISKYRKEENFILKSKGRPIKKHLTEIERLRLENVWLYENQESDD